MVTILGYIWPCSSDLENLIRNRLTKPLKQIQWFQDCKEYYMKAAFSEIPREELAEMFSELGKEARKKIYAVIATTKAS